MRITYLTNQLTSYTDSLNLSYGEECVSFREMAAELESIRTHLEDSMAEIDADVIRRHGALMSDTERAPPLSVRDIIKPLLGECRALKRLQVAEQLARAKTIRINIENRHQDMSVQIHYRLNSNCQVLSQFQNSKIALLALEKEMKEIHSIKINSINDKLQSILLAIIQTPKLTNQNPGSTQDNSDQSRRLQLKLSELERENKQLIESSTKLKVENEQLIGQLDKEREAKPIVQSVIDSANSKIAECSSWLDWLKGTLGVLEPPLEDQLSEEFQTADWEPTLGASCRELSRSVQRYPSSMLEQMKAEVGRKLTNEEARDPTSARFSVADFKKGSFVLFLPTKPMGPYKSVPKAFCIDNKQYFLHKDCYEYFKLKPEQSLATWLLGQATEEPIKDTAHHVCHYPAGRTGTEFFTIRANLHFSPVAKPN
ncbi:hypothetical protein LOD99_9531 [Oopsacas minuta]|uniref:Autophagy-related protein 11 C-terminal domain-containing protein n=1 Tax=Oopsacas minuta TaxID=111878 RepID=A0AAV7JBJ9_9METZ|nr:hypothetical protein LOD99_9531 [Oopsacas minuta]